jgi:DNA-binding transcriptional regulator YiaG
MNERDAVLLVEARSKSKSGKARQSREASNLSRGEVAAVVGVQESTVFRWEAGSRAPRGVPGVRYGRFLRLLEAQQ